MTITPELPVQRCIDAYDKACDLDDARNDHSPESLKRVNRAYRDAMPFLTSDPDAIDAFIACVTHGLIIQVFEPAEASKLLYAAQVAITSRRARTEAARHQPQSQPSVVQPAPQPTPTPLPPPQAHSVTLSRCNSVTGEPSPLPPAVKGGEAAVAAPPVPRKDMQAARNQVDELLQQLYAGKLPAQPAFDPVKKGQVPPTPTPFSTSGQPLRTASYQPPAR
jgi:hypothetical protein